MANQLQLKRASNGTDLPMSNVADALVGEPYFNTLTTVPGTAGDGDGNLYVADSASTFVHIGGSTYTARVDEFLTAATAAASGTQTILSDTTQGGSIAFSVVSTANNTTYVWPGALPGSNSVLQSDTSGNLTWVTQTGGYTQWQITADSGTQQAVTNNEVVTIAGGLNVTTTVGATDTVTVDLDQVLVDSNANSVLDVTGGTASAVNYIDINNAATGSGPEIAAVGTDTDIDLELLAKGAGVVTAGGIEVVTTTGTQTLTGKTFDANGTNNSLSNVEVADFAATAIVTETEGLNSSDNDSSLPTTAAVKDYVDTQITAQDLDITDGTTTSAVDLDSQTMTIQGTASEVEVGLSGQVFTVGLPTNVTVTGDLAVNGADITTTATGTATLFNTNAATLNIGGAATAVNIGAASGTTTIKGNLTVDGTTTTVDSTVVTIADLNITLASGAADAAAADGAGLTIAGANATWTFEDDFVLTGTEDAWRSSEHMVLATGKDFFMANGAVQVLEDTGSGTVTLDNTIIDGGTY